MKHMNWFLGTVMMTVFIVGCGGTPYTPQFAPQPGESYALSNDTTSTISFSMAGQAQTVDTRENATYLFSVREADDFKTVLDVTLEALSLKMDDMGMPGAMLSKEERDQVLAKLVGTQFSVEVTRTGEVLSLNIDPAFTTNLLKELNFTGPKRLQAQQLLDMTMGTDVLRRGMESWMSVYTNEAKEPGDTWQSTEEIPFAETTLNAAVSYTLDSLSETEAAISTGTTINGSMTQGPMTVSLTGSGNGNMHLMRGSGWPVDGESNIALTGSTTGMPMEMTVNVQVKMRGEMR